MEALSAAAREFLSNYPAQYEILQDVARALERIIRAELTDYPIDLHQVTARAKSPRSLQLKIRDKQYSNPAEEVTDLLGVRVITYFADDVDRIVSILTGVLRVTEIIDKRSDAGGVAFGYRSVHITASIKQTDLMDVDRRALRGLSFEIQVRSILDHSWAEIEHEVRYKSRIVFSQEFNRRFIQLAAGLENIDSQFQALRDEREQLIETYRQRYSSGEDEDVVMDAARLQGLLEARRPAGRGWRLARTDGKPFAARSEARSLAALAAVGVQTAEQLDALLSRSDIKRAFRNHAGQTGQAPTALSHLAIIALVVRMLDADVAAEFFDI